MLGRVCADWVATDSVPWGQTGASAWKQREMVLGRNTASTEQALDTT
jgi:hypothetical protein